MKTPEITDKGKKKNKSEIFCSRVAEAHLLGPVRRNRRSTSWAVLAMLLVAYERICLG